MAVALPPKTPTTQHLHAQAEDTQRRIAQESAASQSAPLAAPAAPVPSKEADRLTTLLREQAEVVPPRVALGSSEGARTDRPASSPTADNASLRFPGAVVAGDRWTYSRSDRWRGVPDDEWVLAVKSVGETGIATFVDEAQPSSSRQLLARQLLQRAAFGFEALSAPGVWWSWMKHGDSQEVTLHAGHRRNDGSVVPVSSQVTLRHRGVETVRVPAGSVLAIRLEAGGVDTFRAPSGAPVNQHWTMTLWYAPELRGFASMEADIREPGGSKLASRSRLQLLRFEPGATAVAAR
jgi:hypothetical protein